MAKTAKHDENGKNYEFTWRRLETTYWLDKYPLNLYSVYHPELAVRCFFLRKKTTCLLNFYQLYSYGTGTSLVFSN